MLAFTQWPFSTLINPQKLSPDEQRLFRLYGKLPNKSDLLQNKLKVRQSTQHYQTWQ